MILPLAMKCTTTARLGVPDYMMDGSLIWDVLILLGV